MVRNIPTVKLAKISIKIPLKIRNSPNNAADIRNAVFIALNLLSAILFYYIK
jgi:hypothetical protein